MKIGKYQFDNKGQAQTKIDALGTATDEDGNEYPTHKHTIVHLGNIVLQNSEYDSDGNETVAPILSDFWHVDALWSNDEGHPYGWASKAVNIAGNGVHAFFGLNYESLKIK
jgi:hypothetical protein